MFLPINAHWHGVWNAPLKHESRMAPGHAPMVSLSLLALLSVARVVDVVTRGNGIVHDGVEIPEIPIHPVIRVVALKAVDATERDNVFCCKTASGPGPH
jgi:hypothetical protein